MRQLLTAAALALFIHGLLLGINFKWSGNLSIDRIKPKALNMTLTSIPIQTSPKPSPKKTKTVLKKPRIVKKKIRFKRKRMVKATPKKPVQTPVRSNKNEVLKTVPKKSDKINAFPSDAIQTASKESLKAVEQTAATISPLQMIREAKPLYRSNPSPKYPRIAKIRGYQGNVLLDVLVNIDGKVHDLKVFRSSGYPVLDRAAASSVKHWLFEPGMIGEEKVDMWVRVPIRFELKE